MMFLVERKKNKQKYVCELFPHSRKFKLNTGEQFTHKMFHRLFSIVKDIITVDKNDKYELKAKSGWDGAIGWYVGYVKTNNEVYFFSLNADIKREELNLRKEIVYKALKSKNIL